MHKLSSNKKTGLPMTLFHNSNQAMVPPNDCADELPQQFHTWCLKMNIMPPHDLPSVDELSNLCRGKARPALSYIIRHYQPRNRIAAFRAAQAAKARAADEEAVLAEKLHLERCLLELDVEVKQWKEEVERLDLQINKTNRQKKEWDRKTEAYEERTRLLRVKASEIHMRLRSNKLMSEYLEDLSSNRPAKRSSKLTDEKKMAVIALLKAAGNDEGALKEAGHGLSCADLHESLLHAQKQLLRKTETLATDLNESSVETRPSALEEELSRIQLTIARTEISSRVIEERNQQLLDKQAELEQECVDAIITGSPSKLVDVAPASCDVQRFVEAVGRRAGSAAWHSKLAALEAEKVAEPGQVTPVGEEMLRAQRQLHALSATVYESLSELTASQAGVEESHAQALAAVADSSLPGDVAQAEALVSALAEMIGSMPLAEESAIQPTLQERLIQVQQLFAKQCNAGNYLSALGTISLPEVKPLSESFTTNVYAAEAAATTALDAQFAKLSEEIVGTAAETTAACEAAANLYHPVRLLIPRQATVGGKSYQEWEDLCKAAVEAYS